MSQKTILSFFKQAESPGNKVNSDKSTTNNSIEHKPKLNGKNDNSSKCLNGDIEKSNTKKPRSKSTTKKENSVSTSKKLPVKRNSKPPATPDNPDKSLEENDKPEVNGKFEQTSDCFNDSPVKQPKKRKRIQHISDSEEDSKDSLEKEKDSSKNDEKMEIDEDDDCHNDAESEVTKDSENSSKSTKKSPEQSAKRRKTSQSKNTKSECMTESDNKNESTKETNSDVKLSENKENNSYKPSPSDSTSKVLAEFIPKRKTARKQVKSKQQKKCSQQKVSNLVEKETEMSSKFSASPEEKIENCSVEGESSPEKTDESVEQNSKSVHEESYSKEPDEKSLKIEKTNEIDKQASKTNEDESQSEDPERESKNDEKKEISDSKKAVHPFFTKKKGPDSTSPEAKVNKKDIKCSSGTGTSYDPSKTRYHPIDDACWKKGEKTPYLALAKTLEIIENISARLKIIETLANYLRSVIVLSPEDLLCSVYLCLNRLAPEYEGIELGIGDMLLMKAVAQATGRTVDKIKAEVAVKGDLGLVAESSRGNQRIMFAPPKLTVSSVFSKFKEIAKMSGNTVMAKKVDKIQALFVACRECEAKYIIRSLSGKLRIGLAEQSVLAALARAAVLTPPNQSNPPEIIDKSAKMSADSFKEFLQEQTLILKTTYCECPNFDVVIPVLLREGIAGLPIHCQLQPGCPLKPMLAHPTNGIDEVLNRFEKNEFTCEFKYDGERAQIHRTDKGEVKIFSRNQEDNTSKYPDVISRLPKAVKESTKSFILDTETVAWDSETKQILPFQVLSTRKKKDAVESDIVVQVCVMAFDLLYLNGESLVKKPLKERRELLHSSFVEVENKFLFVKYRDGDNADTMQEFLDESVKGNCEGLMVKALTVDASYEIAKRSHNWLKLKKDYLKGVGDTLDLVVIGGYYGKGKRKGFYGGFLLACYDVDNEEFQSICKLGTGFDDKELEAHTEFFKNHIIEKPRSYYRYDGSLQPDVWFDAVQIWEIKCADLSISPVHKAAIGIVDPEKGISLRFPRFLRIREDKSKPEDTTVASRIAEMYQKQEQVQNTKNKNLKSEEDYY